MLLSVDLVKQRDVSLSVSIAEADQTTVRVNWL